jgi:hypothetical protein
MLLCGVLFTLALLRALAGRCLCPFFVIPQRKGERKGTKGQALWKPALLRNALFAPSKRKTSFSKAALKGVVTSLPRARLQKSRTHLSGASAIVFSRFFDAKMRNFHQTKCSSRALETASFHPKRLAVRRIAARGS